MSWLSGFVLRRGRNCLRSPVTLGLVQVGKTLDVWNTPGQLGTGFVQLLWSHYKGSWVSNPREGGSIKEEPSLGWSQPLGTGPMTPLMSSPAGQVTFNMKRVGWHGGTEISTVFKSQECPLSKSQEPRNFPVWRLQALLLPDMHLGFGVTATVGWP